MILVIVPHNRHMEDQVKNLNDVGIKFIYINLKWLAMDFHFIQDIVNGTYRIVCRSSKMTVPINAYLWNVVENPQSTFWRHLKAELIDKVHCSHNSWQAHSDCTVSFRPENGNIMSL